MFFFFFGIILSILFRVIDLQNCPRNTKNYKKVLSMSNNRRCGGLQSINSTTHTSSCMLSYSMHYTYVCMQACFRNCV